MKHNNREHNYSVSVMASTWEVRKKTYFETLKEAKRAYNKACDTYGIIPWIEVALFDIRQNKELGRMITVDWGR